MTNEQLEQQSRAAIKAWCDDPSVQLERMDKQDINTNKWILDTYDFFHIACYYYRIAKPKKFYRVGKFIDGTPFIVYGESEGHWQSQPNFEEWLDERKYYD